jgi:hypothetical protein
MSRYSKEFRLTRIASLGQSSLLGLRVDRSTGAFSLAVMNRDGAFLKTISMGRDLITVSEIKSFIEQHGVGAWKMSRYLVKLKVLRL